jgi:uncharacterized protein (DUF1800 family)
MGDESSILSEAEARHLLRRTGFDVPAAKVEKWLAAGTTRGAAADELLAFKPQSFKPTGKTFQAAHDKWVRQMLRTRAPLQEKLVLFWHDHFATGIAKVQDPDLMARQNHLFRKRCRGDFKQLVKDVNRDAAVMKYLDTVLNTKNGLNENYGRELQELFTLGVKDSSGNANYTQHDIVQIARAFTGWQYDGKGVAFLDESGHDFGGAPKVIYAETGQFGPGGVDYAAGGEGAGEIDAVIDVIFEHRDTDGKNTVARRTARRLIEFFGTPNAPLAFIDAVVGSGTDAFDVTWNLTGLLRRLFTHDDFYLGAGAPGSTTHKSIAWPIDYVVTTLRTLKVKPVGREQRIVGGDGERLLDYLTGMGQVLLDPPSVFGWEWESVWISSATLLYRSRFVRDLMASRGGGHSSFRPEKLMDLASTDAHAIVDAVLDVCGVRALFAANEKDLLASYLTDGAGPIDLADIAYRNQKLNGLFALVLESPAYQMI